jgi:hypothetical protein
MIPKTPANIRTIYGMSLEDADLQGAIQNIGTLLDEGYQEKFAEYYPHPDAFKEFKKRFRMTRFSMVNMLEWTVAEELFKVDPKHGQSVRDYFLKSFKQAILKPERG